jgi:hypothetical protein
LDEDFYGDIFVPADILLPRACDMTKWSVIACDQFSSERRYWDRVRHLTEGAPTTLDMIVPEAYLDGLDTERSAVSIRARMLDFLKSGLFIELPDSMVYLERTLSDGTVRRGLVGAVDLESYDFTADTPAPVRASERTVAERLPARLAVRRSAPLELSHVVAFINDGERRVIEPFSSRTGELEPLYDFELMEGGGHIRGWRVGGERARAVTRAIGDLASGTGAPPAVIIGDGNHSLAAAKQHWDEIKRACGAGAPEKQPARYAMVELNNIYDDAVVLHAIHRVVFGADPASLLGAMEKAVPPSASGDIGFRWVHARGEGEYLTALGSAGELFERLQAFLDGYTCAVGCRMDYIHDEDAVRALAESGGGLGFIMPAMEKREIFEAVADRGSLPKKSFSVGRSRDKRYYLECRKIHFC